MKSLKSKIVAGALAFTLVGGAFAINPNVAEADSKPLYIKKVFNKPAEGVTTPTETFTFKFTAHSKNNDEALVGEVPAVEDITIAYTNADDKDNDTKVDGKQLIKESADALAKVTWTAAAQYTYDVVETAGTTKDLTYSKASYRVSVFVEKTAEGKFEVTNIQVKKLKDDQGNEVTDGKEEYKPGTGDDKAGNKLAFENNYDKKDGNENPGGGTEIKEEDKKGFALRKTIKDENPSTTDEFKFKFKVEKPVGTKSADTEFSYTLVKNGTAETKQNGTYGEDIELTLRHNDRVVFNDVLIGSKLTVNETDAGVYTGSVKESLFNGTAGQANTGIIGDQTGGNFVDYENKKQTPTGLLIDNLPFIALVAVAGAGIFFFVKNRKEEEAYA